MKEIAIINGPNLNRLGRRDPAVYGSCAFEPFLEELRAEFPDIRVSFFQSNHEGEIIDRIQRLSDSPDCLGVAINPGAYAHYSYAIADALRDASAVLRIVEVHISNILTREEFRRRSVTAEAVNAGVITGCGLNGYRLALLHILNLK